MVKSTQAAMDVHTAQEVTTLATAALITRTDEEIFRVTTSSENITIDVGDGLGEQVYSASEGVARSNIQNDAELNVDNLDVLGIFNNDVLDETELRRGLFDFADFKIFVFNHQDTSASMGIVKIFRGQFGEVVVTTQGTFRVTVRSLVQVYSKETGENYSKDCRADLGDIRCRVPVFWDEKEPANKTDRTFPVSHIAINTAYSLGDFVTIPVTPGAGPFIWEDYGDRIYEVTTAGTSGGSIAAPDTTIGNSHSQGTATLTANHSWMRFAEVTAVNGSDPRRIFTVTELTPTSGQAVGSNNLPSSLGFPNDWFNGGAAFFESGVNAGRGKEVRDFTEGAGTQVIELFSDMPFDIEVGDKLRIFAGCDKTETTCITKFTNAINAVAEWFVPGEDTLGQYPDAR
jgi:hypothetical protein